MANKPTDQELRQQNVAEAVSKTELFFQKYGKLIYGCVAAVLVIALAILVYNRFIYQPKKAEAQKEMFKAEQKFAAGDFELALNGDDNNMGFEEIISTYGKKAGEAVYLYAGGSALQLGDFEKAIKYFKKYAGEDKILLSRAQAGIGDAYVGLEDYKNALAAYEKIACDYAGDELTIGFKSTFLTEILSNMGCNGVIIKFADARRAALILPAEEEAESEKICGILMPIMIS